MLLYALLLLLLRLLLLRLLRLLRLLMLLGCCLTPPTHTIKCEAFRAEYATALAGVTNCFASPVARTMDTAKLVLAGQVRNSTGGFPRFPTFLSRFRKLIVDEVDRRSGFCSHEPAPLCPPRRSR